MSLVESLINQISTHGLGGITKPQGFDLNDTTFEDVLAKQGIRYNDSEINTNLVGNMGMPAGLQIEPLEGTEFAQTVQDQMEALGENKYLNQVEEPFEIKDVELGDYFSNLLKTNSDSGKDFLNFAKKQAANLYSNFGKNFVADAREFAQDIASMI